MTKVPNFAANYRRAVNKIIKQVSRSTISWVEMVNTHYVLPVTPLDKGPLRGSNYVEHEMRVNGVVVECGFNTPYAPTVHEWPSSMNWTTPGTNSKYLERPFLSNAMSLAPYIKTKVQI